jgi:guanylate kinase
MKKGPLIILSGPSGSGKSTVIQQLLAAGDLPLRLSVSATTRPPRPGEKDGVHYHFWGRERFEEEIRTGAFLEWADVHGNWYGTLHREVGPDREQGFGVILDIDVQGAAQVRKQCPDSISIFLRTSSWETYERRLRQRGTESEAAIQRRLTNARKELERAGEYQYEVINDDLATAVAQLRDIVQRLL